MTKILVDKAVLEQALEHLTCPVDEPVREAFRAALEQPQVNSPEIPEGWKLVPVEPTTKMIDAARSQSSFPAGVWRAMLAAAEREECAKVCVANDLIDWPTSVEIAAIRKCAAAIRAMNKE